MTESLCCLAFDALYLKLVGDQADSEILLSYFDHWLGIKEKLPKLAPLFVTYNINDQLRGCIGTFLPLEIESGVKEFSLNAALNDPRFPPIGHADLNEKLDVHVTLLDEFEHIRQWDNWTVGEHGLKVSMTVPSRRHRLSGTFLPSVAEEQEWDKVTTLWYLLKKAGYETVLKQQTVDFYTRGIGEGWLQLVRYRGKKASYNFEPYMEFREDYEE